MFVVIFEVQPRPEQWDAYLETARLLRPVLEGIDGFIDNERFRSERTEGRVLSLSTWRDEKALIRWRTQATHHLQGQQRGRANIFADYHLRVGEVILDTQQPEIDASRGQRFDVTEVGAAMTVTITEGADQLDDTTPVAMLTDAASGPIDQEAFTSITKPDKRLLLASWVSDSAADGAFKTISPARRASIRYRRVRIIRDYGMRDRHEAPQYFPGVP